MKKLQDYILLPVILCLFDGELNPNETIRALVGQGVLQIFGTGAVGLLVLSGLHIGGGHDGLGLSLSDGEDLGLADLDPLDGDDDAAGPGQLLGEVSGDDVLDDLGEGPLLSDGDEGLSDDPPHGVLLGGLDAPVGDGHGLDPVGEPVLGDDVDDVVGLGLSPAGQPPDVVAGQVVADECGLGVVSVDGCDLELHLSFTLRPAAALTFFAGAISMTPFTGRWDSMIVLKAMLESEKMSALKNTHSQTFCTYHIKELFILIGLVPLIFEFNLNFLRVETPRTGHRG